LLRRVYTLAENLRVTSSSLHDKFKQTSNLANTCLTTRTNDLFRFVRKHFGKRRRIRNGLIADRLLLPPTLLILRESVTGNNAKEH
jgi:hypothetical protein